jgi:hypothetical protein
MKKSFLFFIVPVLANANTSSTDHAQTFFFKKSTQRISTISAMDIQHRNVDKFQSIAAMDGIKVYIIQGLTEAVRVETTSANFGNKIKTVVNKGILRIYFDASEDPNWKGLVNSKEQFKVYVTTNDIATLSAENGASVNFENEFTSSSDLVVKLQSGALLTGQVTTKNMKIAIRGGASSYLNGNVDQLDIQLTEGSRMLSPTLKINNCIAHASGASQAKLLVNGTLQAEAVNESVIKYRGNAELKNQVESQGGKVVHI